MININLDNSSLQKVYIGKSLRSNADPKKGKNRQEEATDMKEHGVVNSEDQETVVNTGDIGIDGESNDVANLQNEVPGTSPSYEPGFEDMDEQIVFPAEEGE